MKISRSKVTNIIFVLILFLVSFIYSFVIVKDNDDDTLKNLYTYDETDENIIKEEIQDPTINVENTKNEVTKEQVSQNEEIVSEEVIPIVYDGMTLEQLANKLNLSLNSNISGYGNFIASYSLEKGVDPYLATAIMLHETGCTWDCSYLVKTCHNVGGMKGSGCGAYGYFNTLEEGIQRFIDNIYNNYYAYGLTNANLMGSKYAEDPGWSSKVNNYIEKIKNR